MIFYLGTHEVTWLGKTDVPLFYTHRRLKPRRTFPRALGPWALDSGGYTELGKYGRWVETPEAYAADVRRYAEQIGNLRFALTQDWMTLPDLLELTGLTVEEHQRRTVRSYLDLRELAPDLPWAPTLQGWTAEEYLRCADLYADAGVDLKALPVVGLGSIAGRQETEAARLIIRRVATLGLRVHGLGVKTGLRTNGQLLDSSDSLAWSYRARKAARTRAKLGLRGSVPGCERLASCANCLHFALSWREEILSGAGTVEDGIQEDLFG